MIVSHKAFYKSNRATDVRAKGYKKFTNFEPLTLFWFYEVQLPSESISKIILFHNDRSPYGCPVRSMFIDPCGSVFSKSKTNYS